jgi:hypothetical protein
MSENLSNPDSLASRNLVFNSGFEQPPLNSGFDWRFSGQPYIALDFSDSNAHTGQHALRIDFTVPQNLDYELTYQFIPVIPGQSYELSGFLKSQAIASDSGPRLRVIDPNCLDCLNTVTESVTGTAGWRQVAARFTAGSATNLIRLSIWRARGRSYPMEISGQAWVDDISILPVSPDSTPLQ